jgi:serine/threonine protein phosphatase PrpC
VANPFGLPTVLRIFACSSYEEGNPRKVNQDNYAIAPNLGSSDIAFYGCFDGHGAVGHDVSKYIRDRLPVAVAACLNDVDSPAASDIHKALDEAFVTSNNGALCF